MVGGQQGTGAGRERERKKRKMDRRKETGHMKTAGIFCSFAKL